MINQFVDHFKTKEYGFNFFPALGLIVGAMLANGFRLLYFFIEDIVKGYHSFSTAELFSWVSIFYPLFIGVLLVLICHMVKNDIAFIVVFSLAYMIVGILLRWVSWVTFRYPAVFYREMSMAKVVLNIDNIVGTFIYALGLALAIYLLYLIFKRLDYALLIGFPMGELIIQFYNVVQNVIAGGKPHFAPDYYALSLIEGALMGFFFYLGYILFRRGRGWRLAGQEFCRTGEGTAPRTNHLPTRFYFGLLLGAAILELVPFAIIMTRVNSVRVGVELSRGESAMTSGALSGVLNESWVIAALVLSTILVLFSAVVFLLFIYKMWTALQDGRAGTSPLMAALLLLIPGFNLYWIFRVYYGFAKEYNVLASRHQLNVPRLPAGLYLTLSIVAVIDVAALLPYGVDISISIIVSVLHVSIGLAVIYLTCQAVNRIPAEIYQRPQALRPGA
jgi:hypothetical protein